jgi:choloylglycine hydrolase
MSAGYTCTTFFIHHIGKSVLGHNYDWFIERGMVIINKKGVSKQAMAEPEMDAGPYAEWISKYGSVTFNQYGREFPMGGMNEVGLVIHLMMLTETTFPVPDERPVIKELQWVQYHLDNFATVEEVIKSQSQIRILTNERPGIHFLVADANGDCATIEFLEGDLVVHSKETLPVKALANNTYSDSLANLKMHAGFGGKLPIHKGESSLQRFNYAAKMLREFQLNPKASMVDYAFEILNSVRQSVSTQWSVVYDLNNQIVYFSTKQHPSIKTVDLSTFDLRCSTQIKVRDMDIDLEGDVRALFYDYSKDTNYNLIRDAFNGTGFLRNIPISYIERRAAHPDSHICKE